MKKYLVLGVIVCALQVNAQYTNDSSGVGTKQTTTTTTTSDADSPALMDNNSTVRTDTTTTNVNTTDDSRVYRDTSYSGMSSTTPRRYVGGAPTGWASFAEISSGYTANNNNIPVEGVPSSIKLLGSYYTPTTSGVFDLGVGSHTQTFIDIGRPDENTTTTIMELAARYQTENRWQVGAVYNQLFDRGANYFANQADVMFGGLQLMKEFSLGTDTHMRVGLRAMRDINIENTDVDMAQLDIGLGYDPQ